LIKAGWPRPWEDEGQNFDLITSDFTYVRVVGGPERDRGKKTTTWTKVIVIREGDLSEWVSLLKEVQEAAHHDSGFCQ